MKSTAEIIFRVKTRATTEDGKPVKFESFDRSAAIRKRDELRQSGRDPQARIIGIPAVGR